MEENKIVVIKVTWTTREKLKARGKKGDRYEDVIIAMFKELDTENTEVSAT